MKTGKQILDEYARQQPTETKGFVSLESMINEALAVAALEQDKKTRHACAEAVSQCKNFGVTNFIKDSDAHAACMNARGLE